MKTDETTVNADKNKVILDDKEIERRALTAKFSRPPPPRKRAAVPTIQPAASTPPSCTNGNLNPPSIVTNSPSTSSQSELRHDRSSVCDPSPIPSESHETLSEVSSVEFKYDQAEENGTETVQEAETAVDVEVFRFDVDDSQGPSKESSDASEDSGFGGSNTEHEDTCKQNVASVKKEESELCGEQTSEEGPSKRLRPRRSRAVAEENDSEDDLTLAQLVPKNKTVSSATISTPLKIEDSVTYFTLAEDSKSNSQKDDVCTLLMGGCLPPRWTDSDDEPLESGSADCDDVETNPIFFCSELDSLLLGHNSEDVSETPGILTVPVGKIDPIRKYHCPMVSLRGILESLHPKMPSSGRLNFLPDQRDHSPIPFEHEKNISIDQSQPSTSFDNVIVESDRSKISVNASNGNSSRMGGSNRKSGASRMNSGRMGGSKESRITVPRIVTESTVLREAFPPLPQSSSIPSSSSLPVRSACFPAVKQDRPSIGHSPSPLTISVSPHNFPLSSPSPSLYPLKRPPNVLASASASEKRQPTIKETIVLDDDEDEIQVIKQVQSKRTVHPAKPQFVDRRPSHLNGCSNQPGPSSSSSSPLVHTQHSPSLPDGIYRIQRNGGVNMDTIPMRPHSSYKMVEQPGTHSNGFLSPVFDYNSQIRESELPDLPVLVGQLTGLIGLEATDTAKSDWFTNLVQEAFECANRLDSLLEQQNKTISEETERIESLKRMRRQLAVSIRNGTRHPSQPSMPVLMRQQQTFSSSHGHSMGVHSLSSPQSIRYAGSSSSPHFISSIPNSSSDSFTRSVVVRKRSGPEDSVVFVKRTSTGSSSMYYQ